jgi:hypothetical protein
MTSLYGISIRRSVHPEVNMYVNRVLENSFPLLEKVIIIIPIGIKILLNLN